MKAATRSTLILWGLVDLLLIILSGWVMIVLGRVVFGDGFPAIARIAVLLFVGIFVLQIVMAGRRLVNRKP